MRLPPKELDALIADISARVRRVVPQMPQDEFDALVRRMAELELRYAEREITGEMAAIALTLRPIASPEPSAERPTRPPRELPADR